jgi:hypothetical protein
MLKVKVYIFFTITMYLFLSLLRKHSPEAVLGSLPTEVLGDVVMAWVYPQ